MRILLAIIILFGLMGCTVNPSKLSNDYVQKFADKVRCATGYKGGCWCFIASRKTGNTDSTGIGMTLAPEDYCK